MIRTLNRVVTLATSLIFAGLAYGQVQPEAPQDGRGYLTAIQGNALYIDQRLYRVTAQTRQGETLSDQSEAEWRRKVEFSAGDEVLFETVGENTNQLDFILRRLK